MKRTLAFIFVVTQCAAFGNENSSRNCDALLKLTVPLFRSASKLIHIMVYEAMM